MPVEFALSLREEQQLCQRHWRAAPGVNRSALRRIEEGNARGDTGIIERLLKLAVRIEAWAEPGWMLGEISP